MCRRQKPIKKQDSFVFKHVPGTDKVRDLVQVAISHHLSFLTSKMRIAVLCSQESSKEERILQTYMPGTERVLSKWAVYICSKGIQSTSPNLLFPPHQLDRRLIVWCEGRYMFSSIYYESGGSLSWKKTANLWEIYIRSAASHPYLRLLIFRRLSEQKTSNVWTLGWSPISAPGLVNTLAFCHWWA